MCQTAEAKLSQQKEDFITLEIGCVTSVHRFVLFFHGYPLVNEFLYFHVETREN